MNASFVCFFVSCQCSVVVMEWAWWFEPSQHLSTARLLPILHCTREKMGTAQVRKPMGQDYDRLVSEGSRREGGGEKNGKGWCSHHFPEAVCVVANSHQNTFLSGFIAECDVVWHGLSLELVCTYCPNFSLSTSLHSLSLFAGRGGLGGKKKPWHFANASALVCDQLCFSHKHKTLHRADCTVKTVKSIPARPCVLSILLTFYSSPWCDLLPLFS